MKKNNFSFKLLNHASFLLSSGGTRLLFDPWYEGTCFRGGWGLRYDNPDALTDAATATHLWISHYHGDHLHLPTLRRLASSNPGLHVFANVSDNFEMVTPLRAAGFTQVHPLSERRRVRVDEDLFITRYPCTGIDNFLVIETAGVKIMNFNDCNLPVSSIRSLVRRIGRIDLLFTNFNHAYKLLEPADAATVKTRLAGRFKRILDAVRPVRAVPFASMHRYLSPDSQDQNGKMLTSEDLSAADERVLSLGFGDICEWTAGEELRILRRRPALEPSPGILKTYTNSVSEPELRRALEEYLDHLRGYFGPLCACVPTLRIRIKDWAEGGLEADLGRASSTRLTTGPYHIASHSSTILDWCSKPYGTDALFVGADFEILDADTKAVRRMILAGDLYDNRMTPLHVVRMLLRRSGWSFLWNRREEILGVLRQASFRVGGRT